MFHGRGDANGLRLRVRHELVFGDTALATGAVARELALLQADGRVPRRSSAMGPPKQTSSLLHGAAQPVAQVVAASESMATPRSAISMAASASS